MFRLTITKFVNLPVPVVNDWKAADPPGMSRVQDCWRPACLGWSSLESVPRSLRVAGPCDSLQATHFLLISDLTSPFMKQYRMATKNPCQRLMNNREVRICSWFEAYNLKPSYISIYFFYLERCEQLVEEHPRNFHSNVNVTPSVLKPNQQNVVHAKEWHEHQRGLRPFPKEQSSKVNI